MGFFLHIPFPAPEVFTSLPQHQRLARGSRAFDLLGFQTERDTANFRRYLTEHCRRNPARRRRGRRLRPHRHAATFSIGIDPAEMADSPKARRDAPPPSAWAGSPSTGRW